MLFSAINFFFVGGISLLLGVLMLVGKWTSSAAAEARDPDRARYVEGVLLTVIGVLVAFKGVLYLVLPEHRALAMTPWYSAAVMALLLLGLVPLFRARRR